MGMPFLSADVAAVGWTRTAIVAILSAGAAASGALRVPTLTPLSMAEELYVAYMHRERRKMECVGRR